MLAAAAGIALSGCASVPVNKPCGVVNDSLLGVEATTRDGDRRLALHYERGLAAGCWHR